jgi:hypothetical protein
MPIVTAAAPPEGSAPAETAAGWIATGGSPPTIRPFVILRTRAPRARG